VLLFGLVIIGCETDFTIISYDSIIELGEVGEIKTSRKVQFVIDDPSILEIDENGKITPKLVGETLVRVTYKSRVRPIIITITQTVEKFDVVFYVNDVEYYKTNVKKGESVEIDDPEVAGYEFMGWDKDTTNIISDLEVNAVLLLIPVDDVYTVVFYVDSIEYDRVNVKKGEDAIVEEPIKEGFTFVNWDKDITNVSSNIYANAVFQQIVFNVYYLVDNELYHTEEVAYGADAVFHEEPLKDNYEFLRWDAELKNIKENITTNAIFLLVEAEPTISKILAIKDNEIELLNIGILYYNESSEFLLDKDSSINPISFSKIYIGMEDVLVLYDNTSNYLISLTITKEYDFSRMRVAIRRDINDITNDATMYYSSLNLNTFSIRVSVFDGSYITTLNSSNLNIEINNNKLTLKNNEVELITTSSRIVIDSLDNNEIHLVNRGRHYAETIEIVLTPDGILVVNDLNLDAYLTKVVPSEMPAGWELEALKAQAVAARTYACMDLLSRRKQSDGYAVDDSVASQVYNNINAQPKSTQAVYETAGEVMLYEGQPIQAYYSSTSCGLMSGVLPDGYAVTLPYIQGKNLAREDNGDIINFDPSDESSMLAFFKRIKMNTPDLNSSNHRWKITMTFENARVMANNGAARGRLNEKIGNQYIPTEDVDVGEVKRVYVYERHVSGVVLILAIETINKTYYYLGQYNIRFYFNPASAGANIGLYTATNNMSDYGNNPTMNIASHRSGFFAIETSGDSFTFYGGGFGHGSGMSQYGANGMASMGNTYKDILLTYYTDVRIVNVYTNTDVTK